MLQVSELTGFNVEEEVAAAATGLSFLESAIDITNTSASYTFASMSLGATAADRLIIAAILVRRGSTSAVSISGVTIGGVTATKAIGAQSNVTNNTRMEIWYATVPSGSTGDVVVSVGGTSAQCGIGLWRLSGHTSATPVLTNSTNGTSGVVTLSSNVSAGQFAVAAVSISPSNLRTATWAGLTEAYDEVVEDPISHTGASLTAVSTSTPLTITCTVSGSYTDEAAALAVWH